MKFCTSTIALLLAASEVASFSPMAASQISRRVSTGFQPSPTKSGGLAPLFSSSSSDTKDALGLTAELRKLTDAFERIGDDQLRYKQLLYMASNGLEPMPDSLKTDENKVLGCLSTVHVHATATKDEESGKALISYTGDSDGLLTKGLVALLVRGLSGNTAEDIQKVDPAFIKTAGIAQSLTPGRNNGFLNMLALMKKKAKEMEESGGSDASQATTASDETAAAATSEEGEGGGKPMYNAIVNTLQALQPTHMELIDNSHQHAGHAGNRGTGEESHFQLTIVADCFDGLNLVKRHKLIYTLLGDVMPKIHALQIQAMTPEEAESK